MWSLASKEDNLWVKWINHLYLKGKDWRSYTISSNASWYWRQLCKVRDVFREGYDLNRWKLRTHYTASSGYAWLKGGSPKVDWHGWVWNRLNVPRTSFIAWLVMWKRIQTRDRLKKFGVIAEDNCPLCDENVETIDHLFFLCPYPAMCMQELVAFLQIPRCPDLVALKDVMMHPTTGRFRSGVIHACMVALIYSIWQQRNGAIWHKKICRPEIVVNQLKGMCYLRISCVKPKKLSTAELDWLRRLFR